MSTHQSADHVVGRAGPEGRVTSGRPRGSSLAPPHSQLVHLQRTAGNAAVQRALLGSVLRGSQVTSLPATSVQRALLESAVGKQAPISALAVNDTPHCVINDGVPAGYHVTIFPHFNAAQEREIENYRKVHRVRPPLSVVTGYEAVTFTQFNVTSETDERTHFYFNEEGVYWAKKPQEAHLDSPQWEQAVAAAVVVYKRIGLDSLDRDVLFEQLYKAGRKRPAPVSAEAVKKSLAMLPRALRTKALTGIRSGGVEKKPHRLAQAREAAKQAEPLRKLAEDALAAHQAMTAEDPDRMTT